jgi:hypothetical protein
MGKFKPTIGIMDCAICLNPVRRTRHTPELKCGHIFHKECLDNWEGKGGDTCPLCRKMISGAEYRVTITIENLNTRTSNSNPLSMDTIRELIDRLNIDEEELSAFSTEINFDVDNLDDLHTVMTDLGITDVDALIPDAEG